MEESALKSKTIKRIFKDLEGMKNFKMKGFGVCIPHESNPFELRANVLIFDENHKETLLHLIIYIPESYPAKPPQVIIAPGQDFNHDNNHYVFLDHKTGGHTICIDLLDQGGKKIGWTPAYTLSTVLMQIKYFLECEWRSQKIPITEKIEKIGI